MDFPKITGNFRERLTGFFFRAIIGVTNGSEETHMKWSIGPQQEPTMGPEGEKKEKKPPFSVKATFWLSILLLVVLVAMMVALVVAYSQGLAGLFIIVIFLFVLLNKSCWKCPHCGKSLGRFGRKKTCPNCGEPIDM